MLERKLLKPGDILFYKVTSSSKLLAKLIALGEKLCGSSLWDYSYSHVSIVSEDANFVYEAKLPRSTKTELTDEHINYLNKAYVIEVYRPLRLTLHRRTELFGWCQAHMNEKYDFGLFFFGLLNGKRKEVCSTFVAKALDAAGYKLMKSVNKLITPDQLLELSKSFLKRV